MRLRCDGWKKCPFHRQEKGTKLLRNYNCCWSYVRFTNRNLYQTYGLYKGPTTEGWTKPHALCSTYIPSQRRFWIILTAMKNILTKINNLLIYINIFVNIDYLLKSCQANDLTHSWKGFVKPQQLHLKLTWRKPWVSVVPRLLKQKRMIQYQ